MNTDTTGLRPAKRVLAAAFAATGMLAVAATGFGPVVLPGVTGVALAATGSISGEIRALMDKAGVGDRNAALTLARHFASGPQPDYETAAKYAMIALDDGGRKYAVHFIPNTRAWPREFWSMLQLELLTNGEYAGALDGLPGRGTQKAVWTHAGIKATAPPPRVRVNKPPRRRTPRGSFTN